MRIKSLVRHAVFALAAVTSGAYAAQANQAEQAIQAPNVVAISDRLVTAGQPTAQSLAHLGEQGFKADIYLAPPTVRDAIPDEKEIVARQGIEFVNIPIPFGEPTEADFKQFVETMNRFRDRKVLVHCQVNMRASSMTFLYRVIERHEAPELAYEAVARVWSPEGPWKRLIVSELRKANIAFEPY